MNKIYLKPETLVHQVKIENLLQTASPNGTTNGLDPNETPVDPGTIDAKGFDFFGEADDEE